MQENYQSFIGEKIQPLISFVKKNKKVVVGDIRFVLLKDIGKTVCGYVGKFLFSCPAFVGIKKTSAEIWKF